MNERDHERCSELLGPHSRGELSGEEGAWVDAHLDACPACRTEAAALGFLTQDAGDAMSPLERAHLHAGLARAMADEDSPPALVTVTRVPWMARAAQGLAAAALIAVAAFAITGLEGGLSGDDSAETVGSPALDAGGQGAEEPSADRARGQEKAVPASGADSGAGGFTTEGTTDSGGSGEEMLSGPPGPRFRSARLDYSRRELGRLGRRGIPMVLYTAYNVSDAQELQDRYTNILVTAAQRAYDDRRADNVSRCASVVLEEYGTALPAYGSFGTLEGKRVLVLGFAWSRDSTGPLREYMVWTWREGLCNATVDYQFGPIRPQP